MARKYLSSKQYCKAGNSALYKIIGGVCRVGGKTFNIKSGLARISSNKTITFPGSNDDWRALFEDAVLVGSAGRNDATAARVSLTLPSSTFNTPVYAFVRFAYYWTIYKLSNRSSSTVTKTELTHFPQYNSGSWPGLIVSESGTNTTLSWASTRNATVATSTNGHGFFLLKFPNYSEAQIDAIIEAMRVRVANSSYDTWGGDNEGSPITSTRINKTSLNNKGLYIAHINTSVCIAYLRSYSDYDILVSNNSTVPLLLSTPSSTHSYFYPSYISATQTNSLYGYGLINIHYTHS